MSVWHPHAKHLHSEDLRMDLFATVTIQFLHFILLLHVSKICLSLCGVRRGSTVPAGIAMGGRVRPDIYVEIATGHDDLSIGPDEQHSYHPLASELTLSCR